MDISGHLNRKYLNISIIWTSLYTNAELCSKQCLITKGYVSYVFTWFHFVQLHFKALSINMHLEHPVHSHGFQQKHWVGHPKVKGVNFSKGQATTNQVFDNRANRPPKKNQDAPCPSYEDLEDRKSSSSSWTPLSRSTSSTFVNIVNVTSRTNGRLVSSVVPVELW